MSFELLAPVVCAAVGDFVDTGWESTAFLGFVALEFEFEAFVATVLSVLVEDTGAELITLVSPAAPVVEAA